MKQFIAAGLVVAALVACGQGGFQRGVFYGKVIDHTPDEVASAMGRPDEINNSSPDSLRYVYVRKTFNPENANRVDEKTIVEFEKNRDGKTVCVEVTYL